MGAILRILPLLFVVVVVYNLMVGGVIVAGGDTVNPADGTVNMEAVLDTPILTIGMVSGDWIVTYGTAFVTVALFFMFFEVLRSTRTDTIAITNHALSLLVLLICLLEFVVVKGFNTSTFFYITIMALIDVIAGFTVTIIGARRDFGGHGLAAD